MQRPRRRKILVRLFLFILLVLVAGYIFRYPLIRKFQYTRLQSLTCHDVHGTKIDCMARLWVHRVNSIERYELLKDKFYGFETDIAYDTVTHTYYVYHPPLTANTDILPLSRFLEKIDLEKKYLWLDTRDVYASNMHEAMNTLAQLTDRRSHNNNALIVELYDLAAARLFSENGFPVAFNVSEQLQKSLLTDRVLRDSINRELRSVKYISQDFHYVPTLRKLFPGKEIITWHPGFRVFFKTQELQQLLDDPDVGIILVNIKSGYYK